MQIFRKLKTSKANRQAAEELLEIYRNKINDDALETLATEDFENLITIAKHAPFGSATVIQAAYSMAYKAGQTALKEKITDNFLKGGDSDAEQR